MQDRHFGAHRELHAQSFRAYNTPGATSRSARRKWLPVAASKPLSHEAVSLSPRPLRQASPWFAKSKYGTRPVPPARSSETPLDRMTPRAHRKSLVREADGVAIPAGTVVVVVVIGGAFGSPIG